MKFWSEDANRAAFEHARRSTAHYSKSFYLSARLLPQKRRWATYAVYAFCRYADNLVDKKRGRSRVEILAELNFLAQELEISYRTGESEHPIIRPFILIAKGHDIPLEYPLDLLEGVKMDIQYNRYRNFDDLSLFCYRVAGVVGLIMTYVLGYQDEKAFKYAEKLGIAMQLTNILRDIKEDKDMGRIYLPLEELARFGVSESDIIAEKMTPQMHALMQFQVQRAHRYYLQADQGIQMLMPQSQFAIYSASKIYRGILRQIEERDYNPFSGRVFVSPKKKLAILLREILRTRLLLAHQRFMPVKDWAIGK